LPPEPQSTLSDSRQISVAARFAALPELLGWIEHEATADELDVAMVKRMQLVVEELFVNAIHHGYGKECDASINLALSSDGKLATLSFSDTAKPFNLLEGKPLPASSERLGGVGLNLVRALASAIRYQHHDGRNITTLDFHADGAAPKSQLSD
jgi:anti-sigma regulatory factor (Ser/Thr protein kinase)